MSAIGITHAPISEAARFFHEKRGLIRFEERPAVMRRKFAEESKVVRSKNQFHSAAY